MSQEVLSLEGPYQVHSASAIPLKGGAPTRALTREELKGYVELFVTAAKNFVERSGGDGIEVCLPLEISHRGPANTTCGTRCTSPTAISSTASSTLLPTPGPTSMAGASQTALVSHSKSSMQLSQPLEASGLLFVYHLTVHFKK